MKQTALEYLRGLANAYAATEVVKIPIGTLRDALAEKQPVPATGEMRKLAERLTETACAFFAGSYSNALANQISIDLTDSPEIIALQQAKEAAERQRDHFKAALNAVANPPPASLWLADPNPVIVHHRGKQPAYDSCTHGSDPRTVCRRCEPSTYADLWDSACENNLHA